MRFSDLFILASSALWQRPGRTAMTTLGVVIGTHALVSTLAIGQGVQSMIFEQLRKQDQLRRVTVWKTGGVREQDIPAKELDVRGAMSEQRRQRLREAIVRRYRKPAQTRPAMGVSADEVAALRKLPHVESVTPGLSWAGTAKFGGKSQVAQIVTAAPDDRGAPRRVVAGRYFEPGDSDGVLISEYLAYRWGVADEDAAAALVGEKVRLEIRRPRADPTQLLALLNAGGQAINEEQRAVLAKALLKLPEALKKADLTDREREVLEMVLMGAGTDKPLATEEQTIIGIYRDVERNEQSPWDGPLRGIDVLLPPAVAERIHLAQPGRRATGLPWVTLRVESEDDLKPTQDAAAAMGMEAFSFAEVVEQLRLTVALVSAACALVALVSLAVAGLGIANTMLMSVLQRTHEIGVMKAVGARDSQVMMLFLLEGALVGVLGAGVGLLTSWLASFPGDRYARHIIATHTPMRIDGSVHEYAWWMLVAVPAGVVAWTTLAAVSPARRAARVDPIEALRAR